MYVSTRWFLALGVAAALAGCGDDARPTDAGGTDAGLRDSGRSDGGHVDAGRTDSGGGGDGNDSFAQAVDIPVGDTAGAAGTIDPPGDHDFFRFEGMADDWMIISTEANPDGELTMVDTVITLYDSSMTQIAEDDDAQPWVNPDSEIIIRLPTTGTYYVEVQEFSTWSGDPDVGQPDFDYVITAFGLNLTAASVTVDPESGDTLATAADVNLDMSFGLVVGDLRDTSDVDVYRFTVGGTGVQNVEADIMPWGTDSYGSTSPAGAFWLTDEAGSTIIARSDPSMDYNELSPSLDPGNYLLWLDHPGGTAGANDFYVLKVYAGAMENTLEAMEMANNTLAGAEALPLTDSMGTRSGFILAHLPTNADVDYFSIDVLAGEEVTFVCSSAAAGSGVRALRVELRDGTDTALAAMTEATPDGADILDRAVPSAGTYYLRLSKGSQDATVTGDWVRCGVHAEVPAP